MPRRRETLTKEDIVRALETFGLSQGDNVVVHSSLKSFGLVEGGANAVIDALEEVVTGEGTIVMPTFSGELIFFLESMALESPPQSEGLVFSGRMEELWKRLKYISESCGIRYPFMLPGELSKRVLGEVMFLRRNGWQAETRKDRSCEKVRLLRNGASLPPERVKPWLMPVWTGRIPETFWRRPETIRSHQYSGSFTAWGRSALRVLSGHDNRPGQRLEDHPLYRMKELGGRILLVGVDHRANSTIHVAQWTAFRDYPATLPDSLREFINDFQSVDRPLDIRSGQKKGRIGDAAVRLVDTRALFEVVASLLQEKVTAEGQHP